MPGPSDSHPGRRSSSLRCCLGEDLTVTAARMGVQDGDTVYDVEVVADRPDGAVPVLMATAVVRAPRTAYLFPGQGIQREGMGMDGYARSAAAKAVWDRADAHTRDHLGFSILQIVRENPTEVSTPTDVYRHPAGVLHLTQFTQVAMASLASAQMAEMAEQGVKVTDAVCAGHSVGEYNALAAVSQVLPLEAVVELVYQRGLAMHHLVPRDAEGRSDYRLGVVRPHEVGMSHADAEQLIADLRDELGQPLEIVNFNLRGKQYAVAGTVSALERLESELAERTRPGSKPAFLLVPGIDVPFHSTVLRDGVAEFRHHLSAGLPDEVDPALLVGRYIPNLVPRSFTLDRDYVEEVAELTGSEPLAEILADWPARSANQGRLARDLLVELLAWQFASPVRWIETQDLLFTPVSEGGFGDRVRDRGGPRVAADGRQPRQGDDGPARPQLGSGRPCSTSRPTVWWSSERTRIRRRSTTMTTTTPLAKVRLRLVPTSPNPLRRSRLLPRRRPPRPRRSRIVRWTRRTRWRHSSRSRRRSAPISSRRPNRSTTWSTACRPGGTRSSWTWAPSSALPEWTVPRSSRSTHSPASCRAAPRATASPALCSAMPVTRCWVRCSVLSGPSPRTLRRG